jgi:hypothetical protein
MLFLYKDAVVDTRAKYIGAVIGTFLLAFSTEAIRHARLWLRINRPTLVSFFASKMKGGGQSQAKNTDVAQGGGKYHNYNINI